MLDIITSKAKWQAILNNIDGYDFYHTYDYHSISKNEDETAVLLVYKQDIYTIALPLLIRSIPDTDYFDATSVWGYTGPVCENINGNFDNSGFLNQLNEYLKLNNIISVFSRLNPFLKNQDNILKKAGSIEELHQVVNIDLTLSIENQRTIFSKTTKRYLNKYKKLFDFRTGSNDDDIDTFLNLYHENMDRVNAKKSYYFNRQYIKNIINSNEFQTDLIFATHKETNEIASAAMMIKSNNIIQYHISGTKTKFLYLTPIRHIIDEMRIKGTEENYKYFNLGGGLGNVQDDLFRFKASFSKDFKSFQVWKHITNKEVYNSLVKEKDIDLNANFFPLYRYTD